MRLALALVMSRRLTAATRRSENILQRRLLEVGDQEHEEVLVAEAPEHAALGIHEEAVAGVADDDQRVAGGEEARARLGAAPSHR